MTLDYINQMADDEDDISYISQLKVSGFQKPKNDVEEPENPVRKPGFRLVNSKRLIIGWIEFRLFPSHNSDHGQ